MTMHPDDIDLDGLSRLGSALADRTRRRLLVALARGPGYPAELAVELGETRQNVSNHLSCLRGCGLVVAAPEGRRMRYELVDHRLGDALRELVELTLAVDPHHPHRPEVDRPEVDRPSAVGRPEVDRSEVDRSEVPGP